MERIEECRRNLEAYHEQMRKLRGEKKTYQNMPSFIDEAFATEAMEAKEAGALGFMARALTMATLPHSKVEGSKFERINGDFRLCITALSDTGLPYGSIPRLLMGWVTTEAVKTKDRVLVLGASLSQFMHQLDMVPTGGRRGSISRLKKQMESLFGSAISCHYRDENRTLFKNRLLVDECDLWWNPKVPNQTALWRSTIELSEKFFEEIITNPVPVDMRALKALKRSPMALDIYCWLTYRMSYLRKPITIPWEGLQMQFGADYPLTQRGTLNFKAKFKMHLKKVLKIYKDAKVEDSPKGLKLKPSKTHIPRLPAHK